MDNLTHSLAGAVLGQMGLKRKTGLGMATLIIAANIPDIDAVATLLGGHRHLGVRRGATHGPVALAVLPIFLTASIVAFDRWQTGRGKRPAARLPVDPMWVLALAFIGTLSHPALDWLNSYGIRLLEPFSSRWYYGDTLFIIDVWVWSMLATAVWLSRRREKSGRGSVARPAWIGFAGVSGYILANGLITGTAETETAALVERVDKNPPVQVVANPQPVIFWRREMLWQYGGPLSDQSPARYGTGAFDLFGSTRVTLDPRDIRNDFTLAQARAQTAGNADAQAFLFWSRMPMLQTFDEPRSLAISDLRFSNEMISDRFSVAVPLNDGASE